MFCAQRSGSVIDVFVHSVYDTLTVAGLELGLLWVGSFHSQPSLTPFNYPRGRQERVERVFAVTIFCRIY